MGGSESKGDKAPPKEDKVAPRPGKMEKMYERALREQKEREARGGDDKDEPGSSMRNGRGQIYNPQTGKWSELQPAQTQGRPHSSGSAEGTPTYEVKTFPSGNRYEGTWLNGKYHGKGVLKYADGRKYDGEWFNGVTHGKGHFHYSNGDQYVGEYRAGQQHGQGRFVWKNGDLYVGGWQKGKRHGKGKLSKVNGDGFNGMWKDGHPDMQILKNVHR